MLLDATFYNFTISFKITHKIIHSGGTISRKHKSSGSDGCELRLTICARTHEGIAANEMAGECTKQCLRMNDFRKPKGNTAQTYVHSLVRVFELFLDDGEVWSVGRFFSPTVQHQVDDFRFQLIRFGYVWPVWRPLSVAYPRHHVCNNASTWLLRDLG